MAIFSAAKAIIKKLLTHFLALLRLDHVVRTTLFIPFPLFLLPPDRHAGKLKICGLSQNRCMLLTASDLLPGWCSIACIETGAGSPPDTIHR